VWLKRGEGVLGKVVKPLSNTSLKRLTITLLGELP